MNASFDRHFPDDAWEEYAMGMLSEDCKPLEEHLLICSACRDLLTQTDQYIRVAKAAALLFEPKDNQGDPVVTNTGARRRLSKPMTMCPLIG